MCPRTLVCIEIQTPHHVLSRGLAQSQLHCQNSSHEQTRGGIWLIEQRLLPLQLQLLVGDAPGVDRHHLMLIMLIAIMRWLLGNLEIPRDQHGWSRWLRRWLSSLALHARNGLRLGLSRRLDRLDVAHLGILQLLVAPDPEAAIWVRCALAVEDCVLVLAILGEQELLLRRGCNDVAEVYLANVIAHD